MWDRSDKDTFAQGVESRFATPGRDGGRVVCGEVTRVRGTEDVSQDIDVMVRASSRGEAGEETWEETCSER